MSTAQNKLGWLWFFVILVLLTVLATVILVRFNLWQQLQPDQLARARQLWKEKGPHSYRLVYSKKITEESRESRTEDYDVEVRDGVVAQIKVNGRLEPANRHPSHTMDDLLNLVAANLERDQDKGRPRTYTRALFQGDNGGLRWYVRRVMGSKERVEIEVMDKQ